MVPEIDDDARVSDSCMRNNADSIVVVEGSLPTMICFCSGGFIEGCANRESCGWFNCMSRGVIFDIVRYQQ